MSNKQVAATVIVNDENGEKRFLMRRQSEAELQFIVTAVQDEMTGLASILRCLKDDFTIPVDTLQLVELTNAFVGEQQLPFFVFSLEAYIPLVDSKFGWATPKEFQTALTDVTIEGAPLF